MYCVRLVLTRQPIITHVVQLVFVEHTCALLKIELLHAVSVVATNNQLLVVELQAFHCTQPLADA